MATNRAILAPSLALTLITAATGTSAQEWQPLLGGEGHEGWSAKGGSAPFTVEDGMVVGTAVPDSPNTFLSSDALYDDFILEYEAKVDGQLNSGVMFRAHATPEGRVRGYQAEIDPSPRQFSGGIFEEALRGWIYPLSRNTACQDAFKDADWNTFRVEAIGQHVRTWVNDVPCARLVDREQTEGFIGLQVHGIGSGRMATAGDTARWREIRILTENPQDHTREMPDSVTEVSTLPNELTAWEKARGWRLLFDGETTDGWKSAKGGPFPNEGWSVRDGLLVVEASGGEEAAYGGDIITEEAFSEFDLSVDFMITKGANSGIKYFVDPDLLQGEGSAIGLEFQILDDENHPDAGQGTAGNRTVGSLYDLIAAANLNEPGRAKRMRGPGAWNRARIRVKDQTVEHWLNDIKVVEYERGTQMYRALVASSKYAAWPDFGEGAEGPILLQDHGDEVRFRSVKIRDLSGDD